MIKFDKKKTVIKGNTIDLMAQWTFIGNEIYKSMKAQIGEETAEKYIDAKKKEWKEYKIKVSQWEIDEYLYKF